jgi:hypothetical protein
MVLRISKIHISRMIGPFQAFKVNGLLLICKIVVLNDRTLPSCVTLKQAKEPLEEANFIMHFMAIMGAFKRIEGYILGRWRENLTGALIFLSSTAIILK